MIRTSTHIKYLYAGIDINFESVLFPVLIFLV